MFSKDIHNNLQIYDQMDWWHEKNALLLQLPVKFNYYKTIIDNIKNHKILDIGCGGGLLAEEFAKLGANVVGIDPSENAINKAKDHAKLNKLKIKYLVGRAEELPFNEYFDTVICADVLEHVDDLEKCISEISRVLKPGGLLLYDTINKTLRSWLTVVLINNLILKFQLKKIGVTQKSFNVHEWNKLVKPVTLNALLNKYRLENIESRGFNFASIQRGNIQLKVGGGTKIAYIGYARKQI